LVLSNKPLDGSDSKERAFNDPNLGLNDDEVLEVIGKLTPKHLYKSMTSHHNHKLWHDVYHSKFKEIELYIKLQVNDNAIIISFKEK